MPKRMPVGKSFRTEVKHRLMRGLVGEEVGVISSGRLPVDRHRFIDLTAGDGVPPYAAPWREACSPGILAYHASRAAMPTVVDLYERNPVTFETLVRRLDGELPELRYARCGDSAWQIGGRVMLRAFNADGRTAAVEHIGRRDAVLVLNDPNAITEWAMRPTFAHEVGERTDWFRSLSTIGSNVCGIKRTPLNGPGALFGDDDPEYMSLTERRNWFALLAALESGTPEKRDLLLAAIERDASQWAYLIATASARGWRPKTEARVRAAFAGSGMTADMAWFREDRQRFQGIKETLFFTQKELRERANTPLPFDDLKGGAA